MNKQIEEYLKDKIIQEYTPGYSDSKTFCINNKIFMKTDKLGELYNEYISLKLYHKYALAPKPLKYLSLEQDYLFIEKIYEETAFNKLSGDSLITFIGTKLRDFHEQNFSLESLTQQEKMIFLNKTKHILEYIKQNYNKNIYNKYIFDCFNETNIDEIYKYIINNQSILENDTIIHGDFNARNIFITNNNSYKVIDTGETGLTDRHIDIAFAIFALNHQTTEQNIETKLLNAYGYDKINEKRLKLCKKISILYYY